MLSILNVVLYILSVAIIGMCVFIGYKRGAGRSLVRLAYLSVIAVVSVFLSVLAARGVSSFATGYLKQINNETLSQIIRYSPEIEPLIRSILTALAIPFVFALLFLILQLLSLILLRPLSLKIVSLIRREGDPMNRGSRLIGAGAGLVQGLLVAAILTLPLGCAVTILASSDGASLEVLGIQNQAELPREAVLPHLGALEATFNHRLLSAPAGGVSKDIKYAPNAALFKGMMTLEGGGNLLEELPLMIDAATAAVESYSYAAEQNPDNKVHAAIGAVGELRPYMDDSYILPDLTCQLLRAAAGAWLEGESFMNIKLDITSNITGRLTLSFLESLRGATPQNVGGIMQTLLGDDKGTGNVLVNLLKVTETPDSYKSADSIDMMADMLIEIGKNEDMSGVIDTIGSLGTEIIKDAGIKAIPQASPEAYDEIKNELIDTITQGQSKSYEEQVVSLAGSINEIAGEYKADISLGEAKILSVGLLSYFGSTDDITTEGLMAYFGISEDLQTSK